MKTVAALTVGVLVGLGVSQRPSGYAMEGEFRVLEDRLMIAQARVAMLDRDPSLASAVAREWRILPSKEIVTVQLVTGDSGGQEVSDPLFAYFSKQGVFLGFDDLGQRGEALAKQAKQIRALDDAVVRLRGSGK